MSYLQNSTRETPERPRSPVLRYGCAIVAIALATWVRLLLDPVLGDQLPVATLFSAVLLAAWYGGRGPALSAAILGIFAADYFLIVPRGSFGFKGAEVILNPIHAAKNAVFWISGDAERRD